MVMIKIVIIVTDSILSGFRWLRPNYKGFQVNLCSFTPHVGLYYLL